jgi:hypothetical protein
LLDKPYGEYHQDTREKTMRAIFDLCTPRDEVLRGELKEDIFAARLKDVMDGTADPVYGNAAKFFDNTYPTAGLKTLLIDALGRLIGDAAGKNAIIRLETAFGGGKTHNLIALYHVAQGYVSAETIERFAGKQIRPPKPGEITLAGAVGSDLDPTIGIEHKGDGVTTLTLWGELAYQLGGPEGYELVRESEQKKIAPGTGLFERLLGDRASLIMIDEIARHLRSAVAVPTATGKTTLADQTVAFIMSLLEFAASKERCLVVLTLASESDAFAEETEFLRQKLAETLQVSARQERVLTPTSESEIYAIVTHRLFKGISRQSVDEIVNSYIAYYRNMVDKNADLPQRCLRAEYGDEMRTAYPFHPELLTTLNRKTATIPNFNQTRGALRLLAWTVRNLWEKKPTNTWMIHPYHIGLSQSQIAEDLTSRLDRPKFRQVIEADIVSPLLGSFAHAQEVDQGLVASGNPPYAQRLGTTIFLHSLTQGIASGVDPADLVLATLTPDDAGGGDDPAVVAKTLERLTDQAWFLEYDGHRYRFKTEPSINKIIADEALQVGISKAKSEIEGRIRQIWKKGYFRPVYFPVEAVDVDDDADLPKLAIMHFEACQATAGNTSPPDLVKKIYQYTGIMESFRKYQNNVIFLVADKDQVENLVGVARRYLAIGRIVGDAERMAEFTKEQKDKLRSERDTAELDVRVAITKAYRYLYYPSSDAPKPDANLRRETLPAQDQGDVEKDQTNVILRVLRALKKMLTADDDPLSAMYVKSKAWDHNQTSMTTEDLRKAFARKIGLRMLLDVGQLKKTIKNGVDQKVWVYYDSQEGLGYDHESPPPAWQISESALLYAPEESKRLNILIKGKWIDGGGARPVEKCPVCGMPEDQCICGVTGGDGGPQIPVKFLGAGAVNQAFQQILDQCQEYGISHISRLFIKIDGLGKQIANDMRAMGLAIPQFGKGHYAIEQNLTASFGQEDGGETFEQVFRGSWDRYKRLKSVTDSFGQEAYELKVIMRVGAEFEGGLEVPGIQFETIRDVLRTLELGKVQIEAVPIIPEMESES